MRVSVIITALLVACAVVLGAAPSAFADAPTNVHPPTISGAADPDEGETLTADAGTWTASPDSFTFQWQRSANGVDFVDIPGADQSGYVLTPNDVGRTIRVAVTASNDDGQATAVSDPTAEVDPLPPVAAPPVRSVDLLVTRRPTVFRRAVIRASGTAVPPIRLWVLENRRGEACPATPAEATRRMRTLIDGETVDGAFSEERRPRMKKRGRHAFCAYLGPNDNTVRDSASITRKVRMPFLSASRARETVKEALRSHGFADRVIVNLRQNCDRRSRSKFECGFSSSFPGYSLSGHGVVEIKRRLSYRFGARVRSRSFTLTDENEGGLPR